MLADGAPVELRIEPDAQGVALVVVADGFLSDLRVLGADGTVRPLIDGMLAGVQGGQLVITSSGWAPGSTVTLWLYSEPRMLAEVAVDASGSFTVTATIPPDMTPGEHLLQLVGPTPEGELRVLAIGMVVEVVGGDEVAEPDVPGVPGEIGPDEDSPVPSASGRGRVVLLVTLLLLLFSGVLVAARRRTTVADLSVED
jgi:hypothetical protein